MLFKKSYSVIQESDVLEAGSDITTQTKLILHSPNYSLKYECCHVSKSVSPSSTN